MDYKPHPLSFSLGSVPGLNEYPIFNPGMQQLQSVVVFQNGGCTQKGDILSASMYRYRDCIEECYLEIMILANCEMLVGHPDNIYLSIHGPYKGLYHWLTDSIPRLWQVGSRTSEYQLLLPAHLAVDTMIMESVHAFKMKGIAILPADTSIYVQKLLLPQLKPYFVIFNAQIVRSIRDYFFSIQGVVSSGKSSRRIYIRSVNSTSTICNEGEIESLLLQYSFEVFSFGSMSLYDWIEVMAETQLLISSNDDQMAVMHFLRVGASVFELGYEPGNDVDLYFERYRNLAGCLNIEFDGLLAKHVGYGSGYMKVYELDVDLLEKGLRKVLPA